VAVTAMIGGNNSGLLPVEQFLSVGTGSVL
jgi:hypothetical protein